MIRTIRGLLAAIIVCTGVLLAGCGSGGGISSGGLLITSYTISGAIGAAGAGATLSYMDGTPKTVTADASGNYKLTVPSGWSGSVTPALAGVTFSPGNRSYTSIQANQSSQDFTVNYTISGAIGAAGAGTTLSYMDGTLKTVTADASGNYKLTVPSGWSGSVTPTLAGATFIPADLPYTNVTANQTDQDFTALPATLTISGNAGAPDVILSYTDIGANSIIADSSGNYSFPVSYNWSGTVTASLPGYVFTPASRTYSNLTTDQSGQNYTATFILTTYLSDGFESGGWTMKRVLKTGTWSIVGSGTKPDATPHGGANMAKYDSAETAAYGSQTRYYRNAVLNIPSSATTVLLTFYMYHDPDFSGSVDTIQPQISTNIGVTWNNVGPAFSRYSGVAGWTRHSVDLSDYIGQVVTIGFLATSDYGNNMYIDDISVAGAN